MKKLIFTILLAVLLSGACSDNKPGTIKTGKRDVIEFRALPFALTDVRLLDGPFKHATDLNVSVLLKYEPDRLLSKFRSEAGLEPKAEPYGGWEGETLAGHSLGHYLSALSMMYLTTGDSRFLDRVNYIVGELKVCQDAGKSGYIGACPGARKIFEEEVSKGVIRSQGFDLNGLWAPFYTQHKILAGLRDVYRLCDNTTALEVSQRFADWIYTVVDDLTPDQIEDMLHCEYGGMLEVLSDLYADTGKDKYLNMSRIFQDKFILGPLSRGEDILPGKHGNTNIPKLIGLARRYELTGDTLDRKTAEFFWNTVVKHHTYVTGGHGNDEYFGEEDKLRNRLGDGTTETCNVYNMLKLSDHIFEWTVSPEVADFYERALFNHILASQNPENGRVVYNLSLDMGGYKDFQDPEWFTCCIGTGMENHSKYGGSIYFHNDRELYVSQFIASELTWNEKGLKVKQMTQYPEDQGTALEIITDEPVRLTINIRYPSWAANGIEIAVNGRKEHVKDDPGSFIPITRKWKNGDLIEVKIPFELRLESMPDDSLRVAVFYGPVVLAGELGPVEDPSALDPLYVPVLMTTDRNPADWIKPVENGINTFRTDNTGRPEDVQLKPFYRTYDVRYSIFWDMFSEEAWKAREAEYLAQLEYRKKLEDITVDFFQPGEMQPERDHNFMGERTNPGRFRERPHRETRSGWFSVTMRVNPNTANSIVAEYWGGFPGAKTFDIIADGKVIATENISNKNDGKFIFVEYPIPVELTRGKSRITVRLEARPKNMAGPVFGLRTVRAEQP
ncbi:MAG TPA: beta-L-arabinofuranosidase domain-containing protein [Bacteroidales bacterium]|nr:beta-L-arabinofuranosidase domain-containing protein [Bacteroidales bacterium]